MFLGQYLDESGTANDKYRTIDTWGNYDYIINVSWGVGYAAIQPY